MTELCNMKDAVVAGVRVVRRTGNPTVSNANAYWLVELQCGHPFRINGAALRKIHRSGGALIRRCATCSPGVDLSGASLRGALVLERARQRNRWVCRCLGCRLRFTASRYTLLRQCNWPACPKCRSGMYAEYGKLGSVARVAAYRTGKLKYKRKGE